MDFVDVLVAEFRKSIRHAIPKIIDLLKHNEWKSRRAGGDALSKFSEQGKVSKFLP